MALARNRDAPNLKKMLLTLVLSIFSLPVEVPAEEKAVLDTLAETVVVSSFKQSTPLERLASPVSVVYLKDMENRGVKSPKDLSSIIPNLHIPDYGSAMTSTIYLRGFGSRIDNPVVGLYMDDVPVLNKNSYDLDMYDIRRADFLRGPQSTVYGRNALCGVLSLNTVSPLDYQGIRAGIEYGTANAVSARISAYHKAKNGTGLGIALNYRHSDGFYTNEYTGRQCDPYDALSLRLRTGRRWTSGLSVENILSASALSQGGYAYGLYENGVLNPVNYNDTSSYRRLNVTEALKIRYESARFSLSSVTSWQFLMDRMDLDQDFTPRSMFTLMQTQDEHAFTQEFILKPRGERQIKWWDWQMGVYGFYRHNLLSAPVTMKQDGIGQLILGNIPEFIRKMFSIKENSFPIESDFTLQTYGAAVYHESYFSVGRWRFTAGLRLDYEGNSMLYDSRASIHYRFVPVVNEYRNVVTEYSGKSLNDYWEFIPKLSALYDFGDFGGKGGIRLYAGFSKGYKAGGFNSQIFSDILQNMMMSDIMNDAVGSMPGGKSHGMAWTSGNGAGNTGTSGNKAGTGHSGSLAKSPEAGMSAAGGSVTADNTSYLPETSYNYELGGNFGFDLPGSGHRISGALSLFYIDCRNQQITVFPEGQSTGRMMANAGRSRSYGVEAQLDYRRDGLSVSLAYGYTDARFLRYNDGMNDYGGNRIPYSPSNTLNVRAGYSFGFDSDIVRSLTVSADCSGVGKIWWDEANTLSQPFYAVLGADLRLSFKWFDLTLRGDNLTSSRYNVFYFKSVGNTFFQSSKPLRLTVGLSFEL